MKLHYYGKTNIEFYDENNSILINPSFTNNSDNFRSIDQVASNIIVLTKYIEEDLTDIVSIAKRNNSTIIASESLINKLKQFGIDSSKLISVVIGQRLVLNNVNFYFINSISNSNLPGTLAMGLIISISGIKVFFDGDTAYYSDLKLLKNLNIDYAFLTVSVNGSKNLEDIKQIAVDIVPKFLIPINYDANIANDLNKYKLENNQEVKDTVIVTLQPNSGILIK